MARAYKEEHIAVINIIPFVDIILVILILFMVTAPILVQRGLSVQLPQGSSASSKIAKSNLQVTISNTGDIFIDEQLISTKELSFYIQKILETSSISNATIIADKSASHGRVMEIVNIMKTSGVGRFHFATQ